MSCREQEVPAGEQQLGSSQRRRLGMLSREWLRTGEEEQPEAAEDWEIEDMMMRWY